jgi:hypothetical protein
MYAPDEEMYGLAVNMKKNKTKAEKMVVTWNGHGPILTFYQNVVKSKL